MFGFIQNIGIPGLVLILLVALIIFGPGKLPSAGKAIGESINGFKKALTGEEKEKEKTKDEE